MRLRRASETLIVTPNIYEEIIVVVVPILRVRWDLASFSSSFLIDWFEWTPERFYYQEGIKIMLDRRIRENQY